MPPVESKVRLCIQIQRIYALAPESREKERGFLSRAFLCIVPSISGEARRNSQAGFLLK